MSTKSKGAPGAAAENPILAQTHALGQSIWYDNIGRALIRSGGLRALADQGVRGVTSNPTIFERAIAGSSDYDEELRKLMATWPTD